MFFGGRHYSNDFQSPGNAMPRLAPSQRGEDATQRRRKTPFVLYNCMNDEYVLFLVRDDFLCIWGGPVAPRYRKARVRNTPEATLRVGRLHLDPVIKWSGEGRTVQTEICKKLQRMNFKRARNVSYWCCWGKRSQGYISKRGAGYSCLHTNFHNLLTQFSQINGMCRAEGRRTLKRQNLRGRLYNQDTSLVIPSSIICSFQK